MREERGGEGEGKEGGGEEERRSEGGFEREEGCERGEKA